MTTMAVVSQRVSEVLDIAQQFTTGERLELAKRLLDTVVVRESSESDEELVEWQRLGLAAFEKDWDNADDAVYDDWRALYGLSAR